MAEVRVAHYVNQFFGRLGGEEAGDLPLTVREGPVGPGIGVQKELGSAGKVVGTLICGDNLASSDLPAFGAQVEAALRDLRPDVVIAGPAFNAGRYGLACGEVCARAVALGIPAVTAMNEESPGLDLYRRRVYILPTTPTALGMNETLGRLVRFALRLAAGETIGSATAEGYVNRGVRKTVLRDKPAAERALDMLAARLAGAPFVTELPLPALLRANPAAAIKDVRGARLALVTTGGIVPHGNPDGLKQSNSTAWKSYSIEGLAELASGSYESIHGGYDATAANANPNYVVPLDAMRDLLKEGAFKDLLPRYYVTSGVGTSVAEGRRLGREIAADLKRSGVDAVLLTAT